MEPDDEIHRLRAEFERNQIMDRAYADGVIPTVIPTVMEFEVDVKGELCYVFTTIHND